jgi:hypothetical protein
MQHFIHGLKLESVCIMNVSSEGPVKYKIEAEVRTILEKVLNSTQAFMTIHQSQWSSLVRRSNFKFYQLHPLRLHHT